MSDFERKLRDQLRSTEQHIDPDTLLELRRAREKALAARKSFYLPRFLLPLGGMTLASIAVFALLLSPTHSILDRGTDSLAMDPRETQDLDFYYWLAETQNAPES